MIPFAIRTVGSKYLLNSLGPEMALWAVKSPRSVGRESHFFALDGWETFTILPQNGQYFMSVQLYSSEMNCCYSTISFPLVLCEYSVLFSAGFGFPASCSASLLSGMFPLTAAKFQPLWPLLFNISNLYLLYFKFQFFLCVPDTVCRPVLVVSHFVQNTAKHSTLPR